LWKEPWLLWTRRWAHAFTQGGATGHWNLEREREREKEKREKESRKKNS
jgi:hypothetical protein